MTPDTTTDQARSRRLLFALRRRLWIVMVCALIGGGAAYAKAKTTKPTYDATAALLFQQDNLSQQLFGYSTSATVDPTAQDATNLNLVAQPSVAIATAKALAVPLTSVAGKVSAGAAGPSSVVNVTATAFSPSFAATLANTYAQQFISFRRRAQRAQVVQAASQLQAQIARLQASQQSGRQIPNLETRLSQLEVLTSLQTGDVQLAQSAQDPSGASSPRTKRDALLGVIAGLLVGVLAAAFLERIDQHLRDVDETRELINLPLLGTIPSSPSLSRQGNGAGSASAAEAETFRLLRTQLRYFNVAREIKSVLITSAAPGDGKTTVAWNLARAAATTDSQSSVLLVDGDLRRSGIAELVSQGQDLGLAEILSHRIPLERAINREYILGDFGDVVAQLDVLTAGGSPPNPYELMDSANLRDLVEELHGRYDFIVFDAPPISIVSDAIPLMLQVDGILVVVRLRRTQRSAARRLMEQIADLGAPALGLVLNGVRTREAGYYGNTYQPGSGSRDADSTPDGRREAARSER